MDLNSSEPSLFIERVESAKQEAETMLLSNSLAAKYPELVPEAVYRFGFYVNRRIADLREAGKNPNALFDPATPDYVLRPSFVASFLPSEGQVAAHLAPTRASSNAESNPPSGEGGSASGAAPLSQRLLDESTTAYLTRIGIAYYR